MDKDKRSLKDLFKPENKKLRMNVITAFAAGIVLILMGNTFFKTNESSPPSVPMPTEVKAEDTSIEYDKTERNLEKRLEAILSQVEGAGELKVMVTASCSSELVVAQELKKEKTTTQETVGQGDTRNIESEKSENAVVITEDKNGRGTPLVLKEEVPKIEGVVIVAQGGDDVLVKDSIIKAAEALLNVPAHKVQVLKMK